ncbi:hypothetical protein GTW36_06280 [Vibrio parahaemolyticus]|nr:hypothetical protein [Vibrio parahaemolyticus]EGQ9046151.1 hypothetical protein [Vibrio parahaemolyticus]EGQ9586979.1 hypothetical protein [Vibrio parahaemolyticus]EGR1001111.1 hypothetical protein [Vibrio parahaemolyticus]EGR1302961.1 hypothetical protein [Vibrio parahaemolyticus]
MQKNPKTFVVCIYCHKICDIESCARMII